jgi:hypothetical protein
VVRFWGGVSQKVERLVKEVNLQRQTIEDRSQLFFIVCVYAIGLFSRLKIKSSKQDGVFIGDVILLVVDRFWGEVSPKVEELVKLIVLQLHTIEKRSKSFSIVCVFVQ